MIYDVKVGDGTTNRRRPSQSSSPAQTTGDDHQRAGIRLSGRTSRRHRVELRSTRRVHADRNVRLHRCRSDGRAFVSVALDLAMWSSSPVLRFSGRYAFGPADRACDRPARFNRYGHRRGRLDFQRPRPDLDFLSAGETLTLQYGVTVGDGSTSSTQPSRHHRRRAGSASP